MKLNDIQQPLYDILTLDASIDDLYFLYNKNRVFDYVAGWLPTADSTFKFTKMHKKSDVVKWVEGLFDRKTTRADEDATTFINELHKLPHITLVMLSDSGHTIHVVCEINGNIGPRKLRKMIEKEMD